MSRIVGGSPLAGIAADLDLTELFVLRAHRRADVGCHAAFRSWDRVSGSWMVRVAEENVAACAFRSAVTFASRPAIS